MAAGRLADAFQLGPVVTTVPLMVTLAAVVPLSEADESTALPVAVALFALAASVDAFEPEKPIVCADDSVNVP